MKALFSTLYLANQLKKALSNKGFDTIDFVQNEWILNRTEKQPVSIEAQYVNDETPERPFIKIDRMQWYKLLRFLQELPDQPICLEIDFWETPDLRIRLSQFVANF